MGRKRPWVIPWSFGFGFITLKMTVEIANSVSSVK